jgi:transcriptional regulator with XRE-family HTH domain
MGYALEDAARVLDCDRSKISRIETGQRGIRPKELRELLTEYGVPDSEQAVLARLASRTSQHGWWDPYRGVLPGPFTEYLAMESAAAEILVYRADLVPDLLQTAAYARAAIAARAADLTAGHLDTLVMAQAVRQQTILGSCRVEVILGEAALRQLVGGPETMTGQLTYLATLAGGSPDLTLRVLPFSAGAHPVAGTAPHTILRFAGAPGLGVLYLDTLGCGICLTDPADTARYLSAFAQLRSSALTAEDTTRLLRKAAEELNPPWED